MAKNLIHYDKVIITDISEYNQTEPRDIFHFHKKTIFSQLGEDGIIEYIFSIIKPKYNYYVEFGGWDGVHLSNTANLRINKGWKGLLLEGDENKVMSMSNREEINLNHALVTSKNINCLLEKYNVPSSFDLLSIDIDSNDYYVWKNLIDFRPTIVIVEANPGIKNELPVSILEDGSNIHNHNGFTGNYFGANLHAFYNLANKKGYKLLTVSRWNAFFIVDEEFHKFGMTPITKEIMLSKYCFYDKYWVERNKYTNPPYDWVIVE